MSTTTRDSALVTRSHGMRVRSVRAETREADFIASSAAVDSFDEIVEQIWDLERFLANPVVLFAHDSHALPIGQATSVGMNEGNLECTIRFASADANPVAENVWQSVKEGTLRAVSVGFVPRDVRKELRDGAEVFVLSDNELHEISVVPIPANPEALAKMRARARNAATPQNDTETPIMTEAEKKALEDKLVEREGTVLRHEATIRTHEKALADTQTKVTALEAQNVTLAAERDADRSEVQKLRGAVVAKEVEALVGVKILPSETELYVELATSNRPLFEKMIAQRSDMKLLGATVIAPEPAPIEKSTSVSGDDSDALTNHALTQATTAL